jgi:TetR/AcrR family transcriptional regulator, cmeABC operon repressor
MSTTTEIKKVALDLFAQKGYVGTALSEIADGVGIKKPSLYSHFSCKGDLFITVFKEALDEYVHTIQLALAGPNEKISVEEKLRDILFANCRYYKSNKEKTALVKRAMLFPPSELAESLSTEFSASEKVMNQLLADLFQAGIQNGEILEESVDDLLVSFYCMLDGLFIQMFYYKEKDFENKMRGTWKIFWNGITARRGSL